MIPPAAPRCLDQFCDINRYWDPRQHSWVAKILPGQLYVSSSAGELIATTLGSCVSACIRDPRLGIGGMNHFMLPTRLHAEHGWLDAASRYGSFAMEHLINEILKLGAARNRLEIKLCGGGKVLSNLNDIGRRNSDFVIDYLQLEGLAITAQDLGDIYPRKVIYNPATGQMWVKKLRSLHNDTLMQREQAYQQALLQHPVAGAVELFD